MTESIRRRRFRTEICQIFKISNKKSSRESFWLGLEFTISLQTIIVTFIRLPSSMTRYFSWKLTLILPELFILIWCIKDIKSVCESKLAIFESPELPDGSSAENFDWSVADKTPLLALDFIGKVKFGSWVVLIGHLLPFWYQEQEPSLQIHLFSSVVSSEQILKQEESLNGPSEQIQLESSILQESWFLSLETEWLVSL